MSTIPQSDPIILSDEAFQRLTAQFCSPTPATPALIELMRELVAKLPPPTPESVQAMEEISAIDQHLGLLD